MSFAIVPAEIEYLAGAFLAVAAACAVVGPKRFGIFNRAPKARSRQFFGDVFLIRNGRIVDMNFSARRQFDEIQGNDDAEGKLRRLLCSRFSDLDRLLARPDRQTDMSALSRDGKLQLVREVAGDTVRISVTAFKDGASNSPDMHALDATRDELRTLRMTTEVAPFLLWRQSVDGKVVWANRAYLDAARAAFGADRLLIWPLPSVFPSVSVAE